MPHDNCKDLLSQLSAYIDGELDEALCEEIRRHMAGCENCRAVVNTLEKTVELYRTTPRAAVPSDVETRLYKVLKLDQFQSKG
jgi:anti-sigma factor (TIGR02949 family)